MKNATFRNILTTFCLSITVGSLLVREPSASAQPQPRATGLVFASPQQLLGVPIASMPYSGGQLPSSVDLSNNMPPPEDQGTQNSCVAWTVAYALKTYQEKVEVGWALTSGGVREPSRVFSPAFIYNQINHGRDAGSLFIDAFQILSSQGAATWGDMPYQPNDFTGQPSATARSNAKRYRIDFWRQVNIKDIVEVKAQLSAGLPVAIGAMVDDGFIGQQRGQIWQGPGGQPQGGHAMLVVGYDDSKQAFKLLNSWGRNWADDGYGWLNYQYFYQVVREGYIVMDAKNGAPPAQAPNAPTNPIPTNVSPIAFQLREVQHNIQHPMLGVGMHLRGTVDVPLGTTGELQVVVMFHFNMGGKRGLPVAAVVPQFSLPSGAAAAGTQPMQVAGQPMQLMWEVFMPYGGLGVKRGGVVFTPYGPMPQFIRTDLFATAALFVNRFSVDAGTVFPFFVSL